jgi:hypothetical protein
MSQDEDLICDVITNPEPGSQFGMLLSSLTRKTPSSMVKRGIFLLNWDFTEIGMQTPIIHMNLDNKRVKLRTIVIHYHHFNRLMNRTPKMTCIWMVRTIATTTITWYNEGSYTAPALIRTLCFFHVGCQIHLIIWYTKRKQTVSNLFL